jgi:ABC-2 type transport system ATP-binding protein
VELRAVGTLPDLAGVAGISDVHVDGDVLSCQLDGDPGPLIAALQGIPIHDLLIEPARLEEAFMEYYEDDEVVSAPRPASSDLDQGSRA